MFCALDSLWNFTLTIKESISQILSPGGSEGSRFTIITRPTLSSKGSLCEVERGSFLQRHPRKTTQTTSPLSMSCAQVCESSPPKLQTSASMLNFRCAQQPVSLCGTTMGTRD